jgi:hypothetical protein
MHSRPKSDPCGRPGKSPLLQDQQSNKIWLLHLVESASFAVVDRLLLWNNATPLANSCFLTAQPQVLLTLNQ